MHRVARWIGVTAAALLLASPAVATNVSYDLTRLSGSTWQYDFTITNDTLSVPIKEFTLFFDLSAFSNLMATSGPAGWDPVVAQPDPGLPDDGFVDWAALSGGIDPGDSLGIFQVRVDFSGPAQPGIPFFEVVDPDSFDTLDRGDAVPNATPAPGTFALVALALLGGLATRRSSPGQRSTGHRMTV